MGGKKIGIIAVPARRKSQLVDETAKAVKDPLHRHSRRRLNRVPPVQLPGLQEDLSSGEPGKFTGWPW
jgi:hypothetical protein